MSGGSSMDDTDYAFGRSRAEYDRLIEQAELLRPLTERMRLAPGIRSGMHVLDVGCGLDGVAIKFARERSTAQGTANIE
jgi:cyclopropane fatty-acyl-phospholipid synthase-like methyltransferase